MRRMTEGALGGGGLLDFLDAARAPSTVLRTVPPPLRG